MRYFIGYKAGGDIERYYQQITRDLAQKFDIADLSRKVPSHITLKYPFVSDDTSALEKSVEAFLGDRKPVSSVIDGFGVFSHETIFLSVAQNAKLLVLAKDCIRALGGVGGNGKFGLSTYQPHVSIARHLDTATFDMVLDYLNALPKPYFEFVFDNITLFVEENDVWNVKKIFKMKTEISGIYKT